MLVRCTSVAAEDSDFGRTFQWEMHAKFPGSFLEMQLDVSGQAKLQCMCMALVSSSVVTSRVSVADEKTNNSHLSLNFHRKLLHYF